MRQTSLRSSSATMPRQPLCLHVHNTLLKKNIPKTLKKSSMFFLFINTTQNNISTISFLYPSSFYLLFFLSSYHTHSILICVWMKCFENNNSYFFSFHYPRILTGLTPPIQLSSLYLLFFLSPLLSIPLFFYLLTTYHPKGHSHPISPLTLKKCTQVTPVSRPLILLIYYTFICKWKKIC